MLVQKEELNMEITPSLYRVDFMQNSSDYVLKRNEI